MNRYLAYLVLILSSVFVSETALAQLTGASATPPRSKLVGSANNIVNVTWRVSTAPAHRSGVVSAFGNFVNPTTGEILQRVDTLFDASGAGPYVLRETRPIPADLVRTWINRGITRVVYERSFNDPATGSSTSASVVLSLSSSSLRALRDGAPSELVVASLRLEFDSGNNAAIVNLDDDLRATLTVQYTGTGILRGRWQIAEPESSEGIPLYRTLEIVNRNLVSNQRSTLRSPKLPVGRGGRYLLRFCVTNQVSDLPSGDAQCPNAALVADGIYNVQGAEHLAVAPIMGISPNRQNAGAGTPFSWRSLAGTKVYQLQVFSLAPADASLPASRVESDGVEPRFITGMLLNGETTAAPLSELAQSKLVPGQRYLWRITAHDESGRLIGQSAEASFVYTPGSGPGDN